jgi:GT2 family glycosyltransferase
MEYKAGAMEISAMDQKLQESERADPNVEEFKLLAVVILYRMRPCESVAFNTLQKAISCFPNGEADIRVLLYDNTPGGQDIGELPSGVQYKADVENSGLATAYNYALTNADEKGFDWLLTLDQDTSLPIDFICKLWHAAAFVAPMHDIAAIVPCVSSNGRVLSPFTLMKHWTIMRHFPDEFVGIPLECVYAANSGTTTKVKVLKEIGGYDPRYRLDLSDFFMNHRLHCHKLRFFVAGNIHLEQELSSHDLKNRSTPGRYDEYLRAEEGFCDEYLGRVVGIVVVIKLFYRLVYKLWRSGGGLPYFKIGLRFLCRRLFYSRKHRMESWRQSVSRRSAI